MQPGSGSGSVVGRTSNARWAVLVWAGILLALAAQLALAIVFEQGFGGLFWLLAVPELVAAFLTLRAVAGDRWAKRWLVIVGGALVVIAGGVAALVLGLSLGQSGVLELATWMLPVVGAVLILIGSIASLREA